MSEGISIYYAGRATLGNPAVADKTLTVSMRLHDDPRFMSGVPRNLPAGVKAEAKVKGKRIFHLWLLMGTGMGADPEDVLIDCADGLDGSQPIGCRHLALVTLEKERAVGLKDETAYVAQFSCSMPTPTHPLFDLAFAKAEIVVGLYRAQEELALKDQPAVRDDSTTVDEATAKVHSILEKSGLQGTLRVVPAEQTDRALDAFAKLRASPTSTLLAILEEGAASAEVLNVVRMELDSRPVVPTAADDLLDSVAGVELPVSMGDRSARANRGKKPVEA